MSNESVAYELALYYAKASISYNPHIRDIRNSVKTTASNFSEYYEIMLAELEKQNPFRNRD